MIIPTYVINLVERKDRLVSVKAEFAGKSEFDVSIIEAIEHRIGAIGLIQSIHQIIEIAVEKEHPFILICEDDHQFTADYNRRELIASILKAQELEIDLLLGGVSWLDHAMQVSGNLFWIDEFSGTQFMIIYRKFYQTILESGFKPGDSADFKLARLTTQKLLIYPFMSTQKEFGYSDITKKNNEPGYVTGIFNQTSDKLEQLKSIAIFYNLKVKD